MRTLPRWFQLLALLTVALVLSACGGGGSSEKEAPTHTVSAVSGTTGGSISPTSRNVAHGATATFEVTPDTGFRIDTVTGCNGALVGNT